MLQPPTALGGALDIDWILREPVLVTWKDALDVSRDLSLGQPCENGSPAPVILWIGARPAARLWVVMLQMTIMTRISGRSKEFDFFVFLPPNGCHIEQCFSDDPVVASPRILERLLQTFPNPSDEGWIRMPFQQIEKQVRVLMKQQSPGHKPWDGTPVHLLMLLRSLSEAPNLDLYMSKQKNVHRVLNRLRHELPRTLSAVDVNLCQVYGGRGVWDAWETYSSVFSHEGKVDAKKHHKPSGSTSPPIYSSPSQAELHDSQASCGAESVPNADSVSRPRKRSRSYSAEISMKRFEIYQGTLPPGSPTEVNTPSTTHDAPSPEKLHDQSIGSRCTPTARSSSPPQPDNRSEGSCLPSYDDVSRSGSSGINNIRPTQFIGKAGNEHETLPKAFEEAFTRLINGAIGSHMPTIAAQAYQHHANAALKPLSKAAVDTFIRNKMPKLAQQALQGYLSDVQDEWAAMNHDLHELKDDLRTELLLDRDQAIEEIKSEARDCYDRHQEQADKYKTNALLDMEDKMQQMEQMDELHNIQTTNAHSTQGDREMSCRLGTIASELRRCRRERNHVQEAVHIFQREHEDELSDKQRVDVLISLGKGRNALVFLACHLENRRALINRWIGEEEGRA